MDDTPVLSTEEQRRALDAARADDVLRACWEVYATGSLGRYQRLTARHMRYFLPAAREAIDLGFTLDETITQALEVTVNELAWFAALRAGARRISAKALRTALASERPLVRPARRYDRDGRQIDLRRWTELYDDESYRRVETTTVGVVRDEYGATICRVETRWIGLDQNSEPEGPALIFETEACGHLSDRIVHYATIEEARDGHQKMVRRARRHIRAVAN